MQKALRLPRRRSPRRQDLRRHLPDTPVVITAGSGHLMLGARIPYVQEGPQSPDSRPMPVDAALVAGHDRSSTVAAEHVQKSRLRDRIPPGEQIDATLHEEPLAAALGRCRDAVARR